jgi:hypothetical protein
MHDAPQLPAAPPVEPPAQVPGVPLIPGMQRPVVQSELTRQCCPG